MGDVIDPANDSIDSLIHWLRLRRAADPTAPLTNLLSGHAWDPSRLVDFACIDLIERRRMGHTVTTEHYLQEFPSLRSESARLDLIDAELCVIDELGGQCDVDDLIDRFPDLASPIRELLTLGRVGEPARSPGLGSLLGVASQEVGVRTDDESRLLSPPPSNSVAPPGRDAEASSACSPPVGLPEWFVAAKPIAHRPGRWLIQGRDSKRGIALAMKVIELPQSITRSQCDQALDACEAAARVPNRNWITPIVAAIAGRHLAVIRPWVFATPWPYSLDKPSDPYVTIRHLSEIAYTLQAAHEVGASHGAVHNGNLLIDHQGRTQLVDAICSGEGILRWLGPWEDAESGHSQLQQRIATDTRCLIELVAAHCRSAGGSPPPVDIADLRRIASQHPHQACGRIGDQLMRRSEQPPRGEGPIGTATGGLASEGTRPAKGLRRWLTGD